MQSLCLVSIVFLTAPVFGQAPSPATPCDATLQTLIHELRLVRQALEHSQSAPVPNARVMLFTQRIGVLQSRLDQLEDELEREQAAERELIQARAVAQEDVRPGLDQSIAAAGQRIAALRQRINAIQSQIVKEEKSLDTMLDVQR